MNESCNWLFEHEVVTYSCTMKARWDQSPYPNSDANAKKKNRKMLLSMQQLLVSNYFCKRIVFYLIPQKSSTYLYFFFIYIRVKKKTFFPARYPVRIYNFLFLFFFCTASKLGQAFCPNLVTFFKTNFRDCKHFLQNLDVDSFKDLVFIAIKYIYIMIATKKHFAG